MANDCCFEMRVSGKKENVETFLTWMTATYDYREENKGIKVYNVKDGVNRWGDVREEDKIPCEYHIGYRIFDAYMHDEAEKSGEYIMCIGGCCAWSCTSCMFRGGIGTYMGDKSYGRPEDKAISITEASRELELNIELFSEEPGCEFSEHYYIENGEVILDDTADYYEYWLECFDKNNAEFSEEEYNELDDELKTLIEEAISRGDDMLILCDHIEYDEYKWEYILY